MLGGQPRSRSRLLAIVALWWVLAGCGSLAGNPVLPPDGIPAGLTCEGIVEDRCERIASDHGFPGDGALAAMRVRCVADACTEDRGEVEVLTVDASGLVNHARFGWQGGEPGAPPPNAGRVPMDLLPQCVALPVAQCVDRFHELRHLALPNDRTAVRVIVRCRTTCDAQQGSGWTEIALDNGERVEVSWEYR